MITPEPKGLLDKVFAFCLDNKLVVVLVTIALIIAGVASAPFDWDTSLPRDPVAVDAIPDLGENQQIVFTTWPGRSPQDVEDQITYPLTTALMGIPQVKDVRSLSMFGFSSIYLIFNEKADFYWSRSRVLEKLASLPTGTLPADVAPTLGPDATALGQVFWYTLEGRDPEGHPTGGWDLDELRSIQDWQVRWALQSAEGVSEVAGVGGFVREYQIDADPDALRAHDITLQQLFSAVRDSNLDIGARTIEINRAEYIIRSRGFVRQVSDLENTVVAVRDDVPIYVRNIAKVSTGPALRRGALDKGGAEAVGGVVVVRYGANPLAVITNVKEQIRTVSAGLPRRVVVDHTRIEKKAIEAFAQTQGFAAYRDGTLYQDAWLEWFDRPDHVAPPAGLTLSQVTIVPFYDRSGLIHETLGTLEEAISLEILITIIIVVMMVMHLRSSLLIAGLLPLAVLMTFICMRYGGVDANIVALSGIAIAIGTMVDMGIVLCENILRHLEEAPLDANRRDVIFTAVSEVGGAVLTAVLTTIIGFLPVFFMIGAEGKLFRPLAFTKTFALVSSIIVSLTIIPPLAHLLFTGHLRRQGLRLGLRLGTVLAGLILVWWSWWLGALVMAVGLYHLFSSRLPERIRRHGPRAANLLAALVVGLILSRLWLPLGPEATWYNEVFVIGLIGGLLGAFWLFHRAYPRILRFCLDHKWVFLPLPIGLCVAGVFIWHSLGREFMPPLDEGSYLYMPTTMVHASIGEAMDVLAKQDLAIRGIPEVETVVGKIGRVDSALDPAPVSMVETTITYRAEYASDENGHRRRFAWNAEHGAWRRQAGMEQAKLPHENGDRPVTDILVADDHGLPYRQWRPHIQQPDDIWAEIVAAAQMPGSTSAPRLQPIAARVVMLATGMRAPIGLKIFGPDQATIEAFGRRVEGFLQDGTVAGINPATVYSERIVGKPYLEINLDRERAARYGIRIGDAQHVISVAVGGMRITTTVEGRERYGVRVRYLRELRDTIEDLGGILIAGAGGVQVPLKAIADIEYVRGPQVIKSEDTQLVLYVTMDIKPGNAEVDVVEAAERYLARLQTDGKLVKPTGVGYRFAGNYENQIRAQRTLLWTLPLALFAIFLILYFQFKSVITTGLVFTGVFVAWAGGFVMLWAYGQDWFLNFSVLGTDLRQLFQIHPINLSVAVWVGFLALFGIATDDGVIIATYIGQRLERQPPTTVAELRHGIVVAGTRRVRPALMTTATTILALLPVLSSTGRGSDIMVPMAIPSFGGMVFEVLTMLVVPVLYCWVQERKLT